MNRRRRLGAASMSAAVCVLMGCEEKADTPELDAAPTASPTSSNVEIDVALFSPRVQREALKLECSPGLGGMSVHGDRGAQKSPAPGRTTDPETDGVVAVAEEYAASQSRGANSDWDITNPPAPSYLFPREPALATRAVVQFISPAGAVVAVLSLDRDAPGYDWHRGYVSACGSPTART